MPRPLVVIPNYSTEEADVKTLHAAIASVHKTEPNVDILVVDDGSPKVGLVNAIDNMAEEEGFELHRKEENSGFSKTVNIGLRRALNEGRDAVLLNADVEIQTPDWITTCRSTKDEWEKPAAVVGALLLYPNGLIQHAGIYFSLLTRTFDHMYKFGPGNLPAALKVGARPVTGALQYIRHETLTSVGLYDETFKMGWEDVDYCIRVFLAGDKQCVYQPKVRAWHHEQLFRGRPNPKIKQWEMESLSHLAEKYANQSFADFVPFW